MHNFCWPWLQTSPKGLDFHKKSGRGDFRLCWETFQHRQNLKKSGGGFFPGGGRFTPRPVRACAMVMPASLVLCLGCKVENVHPRIETRAGVCGDPLS